MDRVRFTISVEPEVYAAFQELAQASGQSLSRAVGDWLRDTTSASRFVARKMRELRMSPAVALRELAAYQEHDLAVTAAAAAAAEAGGLEDAARIAWLAARSPSGERSDAHGDRGDPPPSNTGGKPPKPTTDGGSA